MRILVTGGNGYVGRDLCDLLAEDHELTVVDSLRYGPWRLTDRPGRVDLRVLDIRDRGSLADLFRGVTPDVVIHLAAVHYIPQCEASPGDAVSTNVDGTVNLLTLAPAGCRFVFASSGAVYAPSAAAHDEATSSLGPLDVYGLTKLHGEQYLRYLAVQRGFSGVAVRLFNVIGPGETNPHVLPEIVAQLRAGHTVLRLGNTTAHRDFIHVADAAAGFRLAATSGTIPPGQVETVNLGTGEQHSVDEMVAVLAELSGRPITVEHDASRVRPSDRPFLGADTSRMRQRFGWRPARSFREAVADTWASPELPPDLLDRYSRGKPA